MDYDNVHVMDHVLVRHKIAMLRDTSTDTKLFRELVSEIATLLAYEGLRDLPTHTVKVRSAFEETDQEMIDEDSVALVPILRAGLGMVDGVLSLFPTARVGHIGLYRDEETLEPKEYYCKLPAGIENRNIIVLDPMLATGGSCCAAISMLKKRGCRNIRLLSIIAAPVGIAKVAEAHPDVEIFVSTVDRCLNADGYILPGLGDAGDRIFGTK